jgi:hypothetical protein
MKKLPTLILIVLVAGLLAGCGSNSENNTAESDTPSETPEVALAHPSKGIGPITEFDISTLDPARAPEGAAIFEAKCTPCHKIEERYIGPALTGVTTRREPEWILNMILNPDQMVKEDETARGLLAEYIAPMTNQNLTQEEAQLVLTYFLAHDDSIGE